MRIAPLSAEPIPVAVKRAGGGHLHTRASGPNNVTPWMTQRAAVGDPWSGGLARASVTLRTGLPRGVAQTRMRGSWGCRRTIPLPRPPLFPTPASAAASTAANSSGPEAAAGEEKKTSHSRRGGTEGGSRGTGGGGVGWRRHPNPRAAQTSPLRVCLGPGLARSPFPSST